MVENVSKGNNQELFNQCSSAITGNINFSLLGRNETYRAFTYFISEFDGSVNQLKQIFIELVNTAKLRFFGGDAVNNGGIFFTLLIVMIMGGIGLTTGNPVITVILTLLGTSVAFFIGFAPISLAGLIALIAMGGFVI